MADFIFFDRDLSWLSFNERVLLEAARPDIPLGERLKFLSIYSSNLDEFYRVRMPALMALAKLSKKPTKTKTGNYSKVLDKIKQTVNKQLSTFGHTLTSDILPRFKQKGFHLLYNEPLPEDIKDEVSDYFFTHVLGYLHPVDIAADAEFFPGNNKLYALVLLGSPDGEDRQRIINIPTENVPRFLSISHEGIHYIIFLEDIVKENLGKIFINHQVKALFNFKITRDAELTLADEYEEDLADKMEKQIAKRDFGFATRVLYDAKIPPRLLQTLTDKFHLENANFVEGGAYHNLKDFTSLPLVGPEFFYQPWAPCQVGLTNKTNTLLEDIALHDRILHPPYHGYGTVLRFFNESATDEYVEEIYVTLYRVAQQSGIVNALITAAKNGKKVAVLVELKARFDESNNIRWAKKMKEAGIKIHYSPASLKVHAKVALVKKRIGEKSVYLGLFATGNLNEVTAKFYTDHILLTSHKEMLLELEQLFIHLQGKKPVISQADIPFRHLLVAQYNLKAEFIRLIDREISNAKRGLPAGITIKLNNLEERDLISKLYEASLAGVKIQLIVRGVCCLVPGVANMSERISVKRIVDRYLEHGRIFIFDNNGDHRVYLGSADWMNRNIYRRIEVCFPIHDDAIKKEIMDMVSTQLADTVQAVSLDSQLNNVCEALPLPAIHSQKVIYDRLRNHE